MRWSGWNASTVAWPTKLRNLTICLSGASLLFLRTWRELYPDPGYQMERGLATTPGSLMALLAMILLVGCGGYGVLTRVRSERLRMWLALAAGGAVLAAMAPIFFRDVLSAFLGLSRSFLIGSLGPWAIAMVGLGMLGAGAILLWLRPRLVLGGLKALFLILAPAPCLFTWAILRNLPGTTPTRANAPLMTTSMPTPPKAVVLIFDELDFDYAFRYRPAWVRMPQFDRFTREYGSYDRCWPAAGSTYRSLPSLATGRYWLGAVPEHSLDVLIKDPVDGRWKAWNTTDDLFTNLGARGWRTHMIHWHHAFSEAWRRQRPGLTTYRQSDAPNWEEAQRAYLTFPGSVGRCWTGLAASFREEARFLVKKGSLADVPGNRRDMILKMLQDLMATLRSRQTELVWAHLPCPHSPAFWNARTGKFLEKPDPQVGNLDNMAFADQILGQVRSQLEGQGDWDRALVVSANQVVHPS